MIRKYYFLNKFETNNIDKLDKQTAIIYRNYNTKTLNKELILKLKKYCRKKGIKFYLSNHIKLAMTLNLDGAYLPSFNKSTKHLSFSLKKKFSVIGSAHNIKEINIKRKQNVKKIFLSSLFKDNKNYLGLIKFNLFIKKFNYKFVALGGINRSNFKKLKLININEFAGIDFFKKKAPKKGPFK